MYGRTSGERRCYTCGKYVNTSGEQCEHNQVDAEAALGFVLGVLRQKVVMYGGRDALRTRLTEIAKAAREQKPDDRADERLVLAALLCDAEGELELLTANLARAADLTENNAIKPLFHRKRHEVSELRALLETMGPSEPAVDGSEGDDAEVERALALFEQIEMLASEDGARQALRPLFQRLNLNLWLNFGEGNKGKRKVRVLTGGILTSGDAPLPRKPYGDDADDDGDRSSPGGAAGGSLPPNCDANDASPVGADRAEDVSFSKVHRGDRTPIELFIAGVADVHRSIVSDRTAFEAR